MFNFNTTPTPPLDLKTHDALAIVSLLLAEKIIISKRNGLWVCVNSSKTSVAQAIIDAYVPPMINLTPVQFKFLLARFGFKSVIDALLTAIESEDIDKYAMYSAYLDSASFYEFDRALIMFMEVKAKFVDTNPELDFTVDQLKQMWEVSRMAI